MRAAGAEGRRARDYLLVEQLELGFAGLAENVQLGAEPAVAQLCGQFFGSFDEWNQKLSQERGIQPARLGNSRRAARKRFSVQSRGDLSGVLDRERMEQPIANVLLEKTSPLFDHDDIFAKCRKLGDQSDVHRITHPHVEDRKYAAQPEVGEHVIQVGAGHAGDDEANGEGEGV